MTVSRQIWRLPGVGKHTRCIFFPSQSNLRKVLKKIDKLTIDSPVAMAKLAIDCASIVFGKKIGRFPFQIGKSGDFHYFIKNREISRKIGRLGSSVTEMWNFKVMKMKKQSLERKVKICAISLL